MTDYEPTDEAVQALDKYGALVQLHAQRARITELEARNNSPVGLFNYEKMADALECARFLNIIEAKQAGGKVDMPFRDVLVAELRQLLEPPDGPRPLLLLWGEHERDGERHTEWHAICNCAFHPDPFPHVHPCEEHRSS